MRCTKDNEKLGLPQYFKFGIELEAFNVKTKGKDGLYNGKSAEYIKSKNWHMASSFEESLVAKGGAELVSPILDDSEKTWDDVSNICEHMKKYPGNNGKEVVADEKCGLHIHFDAKCLSENPKAMKNFLKLYSESEELIFKMCNEKNQPIRKSAIHRKLTRPFIMGPWRKGMAAPTGKKLLEKIENNTLKISDKKWGVLKTTLVGNLKLDERRYSGLNLTNIGNPKKNTIEFRMANGSLKPEIIKQNVFLYSSLMKTAIDMTNNPEKYEERKKSFFRRDVTEKEKTENFLNLIMEDDEDKKIFFERWESVKDAKVFQKNYKKGFAQNRFQKEELKTISLRAKIKDVKKLFENIKEMMQERQGEPENDR